ncbi:sigma 54-interacting transcriptional regulator [Epibacterium ulvae]|uniref:sigma-54 interaction domain-containing protein n=1 Tax=Epibacterium ulvae TaxID=1156985 RepID=UPI001BFC7911|nr:sigma 54-interacting transcriptional regulator [Epibacterium ulvae]MBT8152652.1 sigma 54-interacting transcriptional regulator [Epibacterium ulvae]
MQIESNFALTVALSPLPMVIYDPRADRILECDARAKDLFKVAEFDQGLAPFLTSPAVGFAVFLEAVSHYGSYVETGLSFETATKGALTLEVFGSSVAGTDPQLFSLSFLDVNAQGHRAYLAEKDAHHRAGLNHWREVHGFFQEVERENRLILDAAGEGIYGINADGKATFVNRAAQEMLGWKAEDLIGQDLHAMIHHHHLDGGHFPARECPIYRSFRMEETVRVDEDAFWRKDGKPILVDYVSTPIYDRGVLAGAVVIFRDITERRENERKLRAALSEIEALKAQLEQENDYLLTEMRTSRLQKGLIGQSAYTRSVNAQINLVAETDTNVLVRGAPGSGKTQVVSLIHDASPRGKRPLVHVDCATKSARDLEIELFGYRKGAFRGAERDTVGKLVLAQNGTLHLDEITDMPLDFQTKLLEVLRQKHFTRIGATDPTPLGTRIISSTARDIDVEVEAGRFRQDLFFELAVFPIQTQDLRSRGDDIPHLAQHFLEQTVRRARLPMTRISRANIETLQSYDWPGNVRELQNVVERAAILAQGGKLVFDFATRQSQSLIEVDRIYSDAELRAIERDNLVACLRRAGGRVSGQNGAAQLLGLAPTTVYSRIKSHKIKDTEWADPMSV